MYIRNITKDDLPTMIICQHEQFQIKVIKSLGYGTAGTQDSFSLGRFSNGDMKWEIGAGKFEDVLKQVLIRRSFIKDIKPVIPKNRRRIHHQYYIKERKYTNLICLGLDFLNTCI